MSTKNLIIGALWVAGIIFFSLAAIKAWEPENYVLVAAGLDCWITGVALEKFWSQP